MSRMIKLVAAIALLGPAPALAAPDQQFTRDGVTYSYAVTARGADQLITGRASNSVRFRLLVRNGRVTGTVAGHPVAFRTGDVKPVVELAQR